MKNNIRLWSILLVVSMVSYSTTASNVHSNTPLSSNFSETINCSMNKFLLIPEDSVFSPSQITVTYDNIWMYLKETLDGSYQTAYDHLLRIHYEEPYSVNASQKLRYKVYDKRRNIVIGTDDNGNIIIGTGQTVPIKTGENWLSLLLSACIYYEFYTLEIWDAKGEISYLRFVCIPTTPRASSSDNEN